MIDIIIIALEKELICWLVKILLSSIFLSIAIVINLLVVMVKKLIIVVEQIFAFFIYIFYR